MSYYEESRLAVDELRARQDLLALLTVRMPLILATHTGYTFRLYLLARPTGHTFDYTYWPHLLATPTRFDALAGYNYWLKMSCRFDKTYWLCTPCACYTYWPHVLPTPTSFASHTVYTNWLRYKHGLHLLATHTSLATLTGYNYWLCTSYARCL